MWLIGGTAEARGEATGRQGDVGATRDRMGGRGGSRERNGTIGSLAVR